MTTVGLQQKDLNNYSNNNNLVSCHSLSFATTTGLQLQQQQQDYGYNYNNGTTTTAAQWDHKLLRDHNGTTTGL